MPPRNTRKKWFVKISLLFLTTVGIFSYSTIANAGIFQQVWSRVSRTINSFRDGIQLQDFEPLVSELLYTISPAQWAEIERTTGIDLRDIFLDGIFRQKIDVLAQIQIAKQWAEKRTISGEAMAQMEDLSQEVGDNLQESLQLSLEIQQTKITQEAIKKRAIQEGLAAERQALIIQQNQEEKIDRTIANLLSSEILSELLDSNTAKEREGSATISSAIDSSILISLPGFHPQYNIQGQNNN